MENGSRMQLSAARKAAAMQISTLQERLSQEARTRRLTEQRKRQAQARFAQVTALFDPHEAEVFRQQNNVIIPGP